MMKIIQWLLFIALIFFTLLAALPLQEEATSTTISFDPEASGIMVLSAWLAFFCGFFYLILFAVRKQGIKGLLICALCLMLISGYRIISIGQYDSACQHVESSVCVTQKKALPLW